MKRRTNEEAVKLRTDRCNYRQMKRQTEKETDKKRDRQIKRQTDKETDK